MAAPFADPNFMVFIIGPMGKDKDHPSETDTPISDHMVNIRKALEDLMKEFFEDSSDYEVVSPDLYGSEIVDTVFSKIDQADLAIADITGRSPSVMYELAFFHALGTPLIVLDRKPKDGDPKERQCFYLNSTNIVYVEDFFIENIKSEIKPRLDMIFSGKIQNFSKNPISLFYGDHLVNISAASGIAVGYVDNFLRNIIGTSNSVKTLFRGKIDRVVSVRPSTNLNLVEDKAALSEIIPEMEFASFDIPGLARPVTGLVANKVFIDIPTALYSIQRSKKFIRLGNYYESLKENAISQKMEKEIEREHNIAFSKAVRRQTRLFFSSVNFRIRHENAYFIQKVYSQINLSDLRSDIFG